MFRADPLRDYRPVVPFVLPIYLHLSPTGDLMDVVEVLVNSERSNGFVDVRKSPLYERDKDTRNF